MHESLAHPVQLRPPGVVSGTMDGEQWIHAAVPVAHALTGLSAIFILDIETPAGGTHEGAGSAVYARKRYIFPEWCMVKISGVDLL